MSKTEKLWGSQLGTTVIIQSDNDVKTIFKIDNLELKLLLEEYEQVDIISIGSKHVRIVVRKVDRCGNCDFFRALGKLAGVCVNDRLRPAKADKEGYIYMHSVRVDDGDGCTYHRRGGK
jgi:hypothetical protein